jgi:hypothetical protein
MGDCTSVIGTVERMMYFTSMTGKVTILPICQNYEQLSRIYTGTCNLYYQTNLNIKNSRSATRYIHDSTFRTIFPNHLLVSRVCYRTYPF